MPIIPPRCGQTGCRKRVERSGRCWDHQPKHYANNYLKDKLPPKNVWEPLRQEVFELWNWRCYLCGGESPDTIDHIIPRTNGGSNDVSNLAPVHDRNYPHCHRYKTALEGVNSRAKRTQYGTWWLNKMNEDEKEG